MSESSQEGYQTLGWIINKSDEGLFLVSLEQLKAVWKKCRLKKRSWHR